MTTIENVTRAQIKALYREAQAAGDMDMADECGFVLDHWFDRDLAPLARCVAAINAAASDN